MNTLVIFVSVFYISFIITGLVRKLALKKNILDTPNVRSSHIIPTPRGGGLAIAITWFLAITFLFLRKEIDSTLFFALLCGLPISAIGLIDDIITISPKVRLFVQVACATMALVFLGGINSIDIGFSLLAVPFLFSILAIIGIIWFTNLFNFLDGIDGYISTEIIFIGLASFVFFEFISPMMLAAITVGFLLWNWQPAKIFMGDVGSTLLGFTIGVFAVYYQSVSESSIFIWLMLTSLFWFDATLTLYRRWKNKEKLSQAHKKHAYQRLVQSGWSHRRTVLSAQVVNIPILGFVWLSSLFPMLILPILVANIAYLYVVMKMVDKRYPFY